MKRFILTPFAVASVQAISISKCPFEYDVNLAQVKILNTSEAEYVSDLFDLEGAVEATESLTAEQYE